MCLAKTCPFFLKPQKKRLSHHIDIWGQKLPKCFHKIVFYHKNEDTDEIYKIFLEENPGFNFAFFETSKEDIKDYIKKLKEAYLN